MQDRPVLGWDRVIGNYLEQAMPFLTTFWINVGLAALGATDYRNVAAAGWVYIVFRALYPVGAYLRRLRYLRLFVAACRQILHFVFVAYL